MTRPRLLRDRRGTTAVEFALIAPVMFFLICGTVECGHLVAVRSVLEGSLMNAGRQASVSLQVAEVQRSTTLKTLVAKRMKAFPLRKGEEMEIATTVYRDFASAYPEPYTDVNGNKQYDSTPTREPFTDRNGNGRWDPATPKEGVLGGPGDVVSYTARFPARLYFDFLNPMMGGITLTATTVIRNEPVVRRTSS